MYLEFYLLPPKKVSDKYIQNVIGTFPLPVFKNISDCIGMKNARVRGTIPESNNHLSIKAK
jgi:hypothetical protein